MKKYIFLFAAAVLGSSCSKLLDQTPTNNYTPEDIEKADPYTVVKSMMNAAMVSVHSLGAGTQYRGYKNLNLNMDCLGNDLIVKQSGAGWFEAMYAMQGYRGATDSNPSYQWQVYYKYIWAANDVLKYVDFDKSSAENLPKLQMVAAQAYTLRAFSYYHLICQFQDAYLHGGKDKSGVPVYTKSGEAPKGRGTAIEVYKRITDDLEEALRLFGESGLMPAEKDGISIYVAYMMQARTALTMGDYETAIDAADAVINGSFTLMSEAQALNNGFQQFDGPEVIWGYKWSQNTSLSNNSFSSHMSANVNSYGGLSGGFKMIDERLYNAIDANDWRKKLFYSQNTSITYPNGTNVAPKYTNKKFNAPNFNQSEVFMRLSEAYFIKAEAQASSSAAQAADYPGAQQTLYDILSERYAAGTYVKSTKTGDELLEEIRLHKRIEMWGEGLEYYDNKRVDKGVNRENSTNQWAPVVVPAGKDFTLRIPKGVEIERNPNISDDDNNPL